MFFLQSLNIPNRFPFSLSNIFSSCFHNSYNLSGAFHFLQLCKEISNFKHWLFSWVYFQAHNLISICCVALYACHCNSSRIFWGFVYLFPPFSLASFVFSPWLMSLLPFLAELGLSTFYVLLLLKVQGEKG